MRFIVNKNEQPNGDHEVHKLDFCNQLPISENQLYLGDYQTCQEAVREARKYYTQVNGCYYCSEYCHTS